MKKTVLIIIALLATLAAVSGTVAYFTDSVEGYGRAASGELSILQHEYDVYDAQDPAACKPYTQGQTIYPAVPVNKIVTVENIGSLTAYVRTYVAVPAVGTLPLATLEKNTAQWAWEDEPITGVSINGADYIIYYATYSAQLPAGVTTAPCLLGYTVSPNVSQDGTQYVYRSEDTVLALGQSDAFNILVATDASQAIVFKNAEEAMLATYGQNHNPWQTVLFVSSQAQLDEAIIVAAGEYDTCIGLENGQYTLPETLPNGVRIFAMGTDAKITNTTLSGYDIELDGVIFQNALSFSGHGSFQEVILSAGCTAAPTTGDILFDHCEGTVTPTSSTQYQVTVKP